MYSMVFEKVEWNRVIWGIKAIVPFYTLNLIGLVMCYSWVNIRNGTVPEVALTSGLRVIPITIKWLAFNFI